MAFFVDSSRKNSPMIPWCAFLMAGAIEVSASHRSVSGITHSSRTCATCIEDQAWLLKEKLRYACWYLFLCCGTRLCIGIGFLVGVSMSNGIEQLPVIQPKPNLHEYKRGEFMRQIIECHTRGRLNVGCFQENSVYTWPLTQDGNAYRCWSSLVETCVNFGL